MGRYFVSILRRKRDIDTLTRGESRGFHFRNPRFRAELGKMAGATKRPFVQAFVHSDTVEDFVQGMI